MCESILKIYILVNDVTCPCLGQKPSLQGEMIFSFIPMNTILRKHHYPIPITNSPILSTHQTRNTTTIAALWPSAIDVTNLHCRQNLATGILECFWKFHIIPKNTLQANNTLAIQTLLATYPRITYYLGAVIQVKW